MALPNELHPLQLGAGSASGYQIEQSLRFDGSSTYLEWYDTVTPDAAARKLWTLSMWVKRGSLSTTQLPFSAYQNSNNRFRFTLGSDDKLSSEEVGGAASKLESISGGVYRDSSAWYHLVVIYDTDAASSENRLRLYVNGVDDSPVAPSTSSGWSGVIGDNGTYHNFGSLLLASRSSFWNGYIAEVHLVAGQGQEPTAFGEYDNTGVWRPIEYAGTYGTHGYYLKFDPTATNGIGHDHSGNGNHFTASGFDTTNSTASTYDVMSDTPTKNWCTLNPLDKVSGLTISDGNLRCVSTASDRHVRSTFFLPTSGKWYWEMTATTVNTAGYLATGLYHATGSLTATAVATAQGRWYQAAGYGNGSAWGDTYDDGDIVSIAVDMDNGTIFAAKNGVWQASGNPVTGANPMYNDLLTAYSPDGWSPVCANWQSGNTADFNFGQREFLYPPGTASATSYFNTVLYTGNNSTNAITGVGFAPDFVWIKPRNLADNHRLNDIIRGPNRTLSSNSVSAEYGPTNAYLDSFDSDGFTVSGTDGGWNSSSYNYVAWCWKAGGTPSSNTDGSITASVSANQDAGFSIVSYTGTGTAGTVGHGLGVAPSFYIVKNRDASVFWPVYHSGLPNPATSYIDLDSTVAHSPGETHWNSTSPTDTVFSVNTQSSVNGSGSKYIAYCWAEKPGVTKIGSYEGNGLASGLSVDVGFKPAMVIIKNADAIDDWNIIDNRTPPNANLRPNSTAAEDSAVTCYLTPTGFTVATGNSHRINFANETFIYIAFAENFSADATYKALNTANLPAPTVKDGSDYFNTVLYNGTGSAQSITGVGFQPDWSWIKARGAASDHRLYDVIRGATKELYSNLTNAEVTDTAQLTSFDSDGFSVGSGSGVNDSAAGGYVAWNWLAGNGTSSNTDGTITSTVSANPTAGFSIVSYTGTGANATVGHGLGVAPKMIIVKDRDAAVVWAVHHSGISINNYLRLNTTDSEVAGLAVWNQTAPTSTVFSIGTSTIINNTNDYIAYCFAEVENYSRIGSYIGNGTTTGDGPFVFCGFKPSLIVLKASSASDNWRMYDDKRLGYNSSNSLLYPNLSNAEAATTDHVDILSNGFKLRSDNNNSSGVTYVFMAFASSPFGGSGVSPATAR